MPEKSTNEKWKFAYKLAVALVPAAVELCGFPKTLELLEKPLSALIEHLTGESVDWLFKEQGELEKTAVIIGDALKKILEDERYNYLETFFSEAEFDFSKVNLVSGENALADHFCDRFMEWSKIPSSQKSMNQQFMRQFTKDLFIAVKSKIEGTKLADYWQGRDTNETVHEIRDVLIKEHNHNADYINKWNEPLCLHRGEIKVTLADIFVMPEVEVDGKRKEVGKCVEDFIADNNQNILLLLGHGGYGKTSFVAHMVGDDKENREYLKGRTLHVFRLREFSASRIDELYRDIEKFSQNHLGDNDVLVFDGLDELCMIGGGSEQKKSIALMLQITNFLSANRTNKLIVTSRPEYVSAEQVRESIEKKTQFGLEPPKLICYEYRPFNYDQRWRMAQRLGKIDENVKSGRGYRHIKDSGVKRNDDAVYGSPFILYLVCAAKQITQECLENRWLLFHTVFHDINTNPAYKNKKDSSEREEVAFEHLEKLYNITRQLSYEIYKTGYTKPYFQIDEVQRIIGRLYPNEKKELLDKLNECYAICAYFRKNEKGAVEFAHNHVRDFFLCEYILHGLNELYSKKEISNSIKRFGRTVANWISDNFMYHKIEGEKEHVETLAILKSAFTVKDRSCPRVQQEFKSDELKYIFNIYCNNGGLHRYISRVGLSCQRAAANAVSNANSIFHILTMSVKKSNEKIVWFDKKEYDKGERGIIQSMYRLSDSDFKNMNFEGLNLKGINFEKSDFCGADLKVRNLAKCELKDAEYDSHTAFLGGFEPEQFGMKKKKEYSWGNDYIIQNAAAKKISLRNKDSNSNSNPYYFIFRETVQETLEKILRMRSLRSIIFEDED